MFLVNACHYSRCALPLSQDARQFLQCVFRLLRYASESHRCERDSTRDDTPFPRIDFEFMADRREVLAIHARCERHALGCIKTVPQLERRILAFVRQRHEGIGRGSISAARDAINSALEKRTRNGRTKLTSLETIILLASIYLNPKKGLSRKRQYFPARKR